MIENIYSKSNPGPIVCLLNSADQQGFAAFFDAQLIERGRQMRMKIEERLSEGNELLAKIDQAFGGI